MSIKLPNSITHQVQFLVVEVDRQLALFYAFLNSAEKDKGKTLLKRSGYSYNIERRIEHACTDFLSIEAEGIHTQSIRSIEKISNHLQDISEHISKCASTLIEQNTFIFNESIHELLADIEIIRKQVKLIPKLLQRKKPGAILKSCLKHADLLDIFKREREQQIQQLTNAEDPQPHIDTLFISYEIQRMAEHLNMAYEAMLSGILGHPLNVEQLLAIKKGIKKMDVSRGLSDINIETLALTKSGSTVSALFDSSQNQVKSTKTIAVFKDGEKRKLREELDSLEAWQYIHKGLAPQIYQFKKSGNRASMLVEHIAGQTFEELLLQSDDSRRKNANITLANTLREIYHKTQSVDRKSARFMPQLLNRFDAILNVHPEFDNQLIRQKIELAASYEKRKIANIPTVFIHGDFNIDNIIYNAKANTVHFIDLRRSTYQDYVQDISVFLVSNYRIGTTSQKVRTRINEQNNFFIDFARSYAREIDDKSFEIRLALGLSRSLLTSTRFIFDKERSESMLKKSLQLIDDVLNLNDQTKHNYSVRVTDILTLA